MITGIVILRWWYLRQAKGNILEVGCGTGRNFSYYSSDAKNIVAIDASPDMLQQAKQKAKGMKNIHFLQILRH